LACLALLHAPWIALAAHGDAASSCEALAFGAWLATPLWITSTRRALPLDTAHALRELMALRHTLRAQAQLRATIELVVYESPSGVLLSPRLRVLPSRVPAGMGKLELALTHGCFRGRLRTAFTWLAVSREDSRADALLARALPAAQREVSHDTRALCERRSVTLSPASDAPELLAWLTRELEVTPARAA
jgi:hypothetical protein